LALLSSTRLVIAVVMCRQNRMDYYSFIDPGAMEGWVGLVVAVVICR